MSGPGIRVIARHWLEPAGSSSKVTLWLKFEGLLAGVVARLTHDLNHRYLALEAKGLKDRCVETGQ